MIYKIYIFFFKQFLKFSSEVFYDYNMFSSDNFVSNNVEKIIFFKL